MLRIGFKNLSVGSLFSFSLLFAVLAPGGVLALSDRAEVCLHTNELSISETIRDTSLGESEMVCFKTFVPQAGYWALEATVPATAQVEPRLDFLGALCEPSRLNGRTYRSLQRTAASVVVAVLTPGHQTFCVASQDPWRVLDGLRIESRFAAVDGLLDDPKEEEVDPDPLPLPSPLILPSDDPKEEEVDPDPRGTGWDEVVPLDDPKEEEVDPDPHGTGWDEIVPLDDPKEEEVDPDPHGTGWDEIVPLSAAGLRGLCATGDVDDHGDLAICATPLHLGRSVGGTLASSWAGDEDFFAFELDTLVTIVVETSGRTNTEGALYDAWGQRLATARDGGEGENFRLVKTLPPGRYLLRVAGQSGAEGAYRLILDQLSF